METNLKEGYIFRSVKADWKTAIKQQHVLRIVDSHSLLHIAAKSVEGFHVLRRM